MHRLAQYDWDHAGAAELCIAVDLREGPPGSIASTAECHSSDRETRAMTCRKRSHRRPTSWRLGDLDLPPQHRRHHCLPLSPMLYLRSYLLIDQRIPVVVRRCSVQRESLPDRRRAPETACFGPRGPSEWHLH